MSDVNNGAAEAGAENDAGKNPGTQQPAQADTTENAANSEQNNANDAGAEGGEGEEGKEKPKSRGGFQRRIDKLTGERAEAQREAEFWKREALKGKGPDGDGDQDRGKPTTSTDAAPDPKDFQDYEEYLVAKAEYRLEQKAKARDAQQKSEASKANDEKLRNTFAKAVDQARERYADFDDVIENLPAASPDIARIIMKSDRGPDLLYHLGSHPEEAERIANLDPLSAARELGRIEAKLPEVTPRKISNAPNPPKVLNGGGEGATRDPAKMDMAEYTAWRNKQQKRA